MLADVGSGQIRARDDCCGPQDAAPPPPNTLYRGSLETYESSLAVGAEHSILFKAPGAQFVTLAGSSQANILSEMHFSRCLSERSKHNGRVHRFPSSCFSALIPTDKMSQFTPNGSPIRSNKHSRPRPERLGLPADACQTAGHSLSSRLN